MSDGIFKLLPDKPLLRVDEVAAFFNVTRMTIYRWYESEKLKGTTISGTVRIYRQSVVDIVNDGNGKKNYRDDAFAQKPHPGRRIISRGI